MLPAGKYAIRSLDFLSEPDVLMLRSDDDTAVVDFLTTQTSANQVPQTTKLVFKKYGVMSIGSRVTVAIANAILNDI